MRSRGLNKKKWEHTEFIADLPKNNTVNTRLIYPGILISGTHCIDLEYFYKYIYI